MRITKLLSVFLAVLMLLSCVAGALATGVAAEETGSEEYEFHYTDPREGVDESLITTYYAGTVEGQTTYASSFQGFAKIAKETWPAGSVLVIKANCNLYMASDATNTSIPRIQGLFGGWKTIFREDGTKLPVVIEGLKEDKAVEIRLDTKTGFSNWQFTNDMYFTNVTVKAYNITSNINIYAGSGLVTFHDCKIEYSQYINFYGDTINGDAWYGWTSTQETANKAKTGFIETGFIFGKGTSYVNAEGTATAVPQIAATNNIGTYSNYKACEDNAQLTVGTALTDEVLATYKTGVNGTRFFYGSTNQVVKDYNAGKNLPRPYAVKVNIMIDNGSTDGTLDFANIADRLGTQPVGASVVSIYSGDVLSYAADKGTQQYGSGDLLSTKREFYNGNITLNIGGTVGTVTGLYDATLVGDFTLNVLPGAKATTINAAGSATAKTCITGNYVANISGGTIDNYRGGIGTYGEGTITNNVSGGTFNKLYFGSRFGFTTVINNISGGSFLGEFAGANNGTTAAYVGGTIVNNISGHYNDTTFANTFFAGHSLTNETPWTSITTNIAGGQFKAIDKGNATTATLNIVSESADDQIKFLNYTYEFDSFTMAGGIIHFYQTHFTANNATGSATIRNTSSWEATDKYSFTFVGAAGNLELTTAQAGTNETNVGKVVTEENGDLTLTYGYVEPVPTTVAPTGATLIMDQANTAVGIKFIFDAAEVEALDEFTYDVLLNGTSILGEGALGEDYSITTYGIGLEDMNTVLTFGGSIATETEFSLASIVALAVDQFDGEWGTWATALENLNNVHNLGLEGTNGGELDKAYEAYTLTKGNLAADVADLKADFTMSNVTGIRFTTTFNTMPTTLVVMVNGADMTDIAVVEGNTVIIDLALAAQNMEQNIAIKVKDYSANTADFYFEFIGSAAQLAQTVADTDAAAAAFLWYIQAAAVLAA